MVRARIVLVLATALGLAACARSAPPSSFSNAVRTGSGIEATGNAGPGGGAGGTPAGTGAVSTTTVR